MNNKVLKKVLAAAVIICLFMLSSCSFENAGQNQYNDNGEDTKKESGLLYVHFIDVGQADSILIQTPSGKVMMIDAGNNNDGDYLIKYLKKQGISKIDVLVGTHPHEDHIGSMDSIIEEFEIGSLYMPKVTANTKTFSDVLQAAKAKKLSINTAKNGVAIDLGSQIDVKMLAPVENKYEDLNNYSAVIKLTYGKTSFLFAGDAEKLSEEQMLNTSEDLRATVLKAGHHGSSSSSCDDFLDAVNPLYAVISVGADNEYGHPSKSTLNRFKKRGITALRTDEMGDIVLTSDGDKLNILKSR